MESTDLSPIGVARVPRFNDDIHVAYVALSTLREYGVGIPRYINSILVRHKCSKCPVSIKV